MANGLIDFGTLRPNAAMEAYQQGQQNQLAQLQMSQAQQAAQDAEAEREAYKGASNYAEVQQRLMKQGLGKQALAVGAAEAKQRADKIALLKDTTALLKNTATQIMADPTIAESALMQFSKQTGHDVTNDLAQLRALNGDPDKTRLWAASHALEADKLLPKFETRDLGGTVERQGYNVLTGKAIGPAEVRTKTATPGEVLVNARAKERGDLKPVPVHAQKAITGSASTLAQLDKAIAELEANPDAVGWKGYAPDAVLNRADPAGTQARASLADIGSLKIHERSGAAVTASETPRLKPFIPSISDDYDTALTKLKRMRDIQAAEQEVLTGTYNRDQGFRDFTAPQPTGNTPAAKPTAPAAPAAASNTVTLPNGSVMTFPDAKSASAFKKKAGL